MKKAFLLIVAVFAFSFANAQGFKFGIKGGVNYSNVTGGDKETIFGDPDYKTSYHFGIIPGYQFDNFFGIKPEILYSSKGYQINTTYADPTNGANKIEYEEKTNLNYISVPFLLNINAGPVFFELGPEFAYMLAMTSETKTSVIDANGNKIGETKNEKHTEKDDFGASSFDFGYVAGIGVNLPAGLGLGLRYNGGFVSIFDRKDVENVNVKNSNFMLSLNYTFGGHE